MTRIGDAPWRDEQVIMRAISDPGAFTPRDDRGPHHHESQAHWQTRALRIIFDARENELAEHDRLRNNARKAAAAAMLDRITSLASQVHADFPADEPQGARASFADYLRINRADLLDGYPR